MGRVDDATLKKHGPAITALLDYLTRGNCFKDDGKTLKKGLRDTPSRFLSAWHDELCCGYDFSDSDIASMLTDFESEGYDQMVISRNIEFNSLCEHHLMEFTGHAHVAYIPDKRVVGISKLSRLVDIFARRLQMQERIGMQVTDALMKYVKPLGAACIITARHSCMCARGVNKQHSDMVTSSLRGAFLKEIETREELMRLIGR